MKVCFLTEAPIIKTGSASVRLYYEYINYFMNKNYDVLNIAFTDNLKRKPKTLWKTLYLEKKNHLIPNKFSLINKMNYSKEISFLLNKFKIDVLIAFDIVTISQCYNIKKIKKIAWIGDLRFQTNLYNFYMNLKSNFFLIRQSIYIFYQNYLLKKKYIQYLNQMDKVIVSSKSSEKHLKKIGIISKFLPYPWPLFFSLGEKKNQKNPEFLFFGNLSGLGSKSAILELFNNVYPLLKNKIGYKKFKINIAGSNYEKSFLKKIELKKFPEIYFYGFVDKLEILFARSTAIIFPGNVPVGNRCRLITCMGSGLPIIAHKSTKLGNPFLIDQETAFLAGSTKEFVKKMILCSENNILRTKIIKNAKKIYYEKHSPSSAGKIFEKYIYE
tara:strand:+ start:513 stop:1664 length:1152 start_codon:yes stop_codon:yes gene_type:complete